MVSPAPALLSRSHALPNGALLVAPDEKFRRLASRCSHFQIIRSGFGGLSQSPKVLNANMKMIVQFPQKDCPQWQEELLL